MTRPLRFLHLTTFYPPYSFGGDAIYIHRLAHALADAGHEVDVVHCVDAYSLLHRSKPEVKFAEHPNVKVHSLRSPYGILSPILTHQTGRAYLKRKYIRSLLESKRFDVIHYHNISLLGPEILTMKPSTGQVIKLYTTHEHWLICPTHVLWKFNRSPCVNPRCLPCTLMARRPPQIWRYTKLIEKFSQHVDQFVSPSRFTAEMHAARGFRRPLVNLPLFMERSDTDWTNPEPPPQEAPYFLFVGRLEFVKGLQTLLKLWKQVYGADLLIAGTGTYETELRAQAASNPRIKFLGLVPQRDLGRLYFHAQACIVPSLTYETFGMIVIESFARKTPVIVRDIGGLSEIVNESGGGFVFRDDEDLLQAIESIMSSAAFRGQLGENGYRTFEKLWTREAHLRLYFELLRNVAQQKYGRLPWQTLN